MSHFVMIVMMAYLTGTPAAITVGTFDSLQSCQQQADELKKQHNTVVTAYCIKVDR